MSHLDLNWLSPVEKRGEYQFKRDDLFAPFNVPLNGGKVRQALDLMTRKLDRIRGDYGGIVCTVSSVHSPQGYLIARCAHSLGLHTVIGVGTSAPAGVAARYPPFRLAVELGAEIVPLAKIGYNSVLQMRLERLANRNKWYPVTFGIASDLAINSRQIANLPRDLDNLVIPCGSGVSATAILRGLAEAARRPKNIYVVQIAGIDRTKVIGHRLPYHFIADKTYSYAKKLELDYEGLELDMIYEAKAFAWLRRERLLGKTCFWVIGNFNRLRSWRIDDIPKVQGKPKIPQVGTPLEPKPSGDGTFWGVRR